MLSIIYSNQFLKHDTGVFHPEKPDRLQAIAMALHTSPIAKYLKWYAPTPVERSPILSLLQEVHEEEYIDFIAKLAKSGGGYANPDTPVSSQSYDVALLAASAWIDGVERVLATGNPVFVLARPPGHHAMPDRAMGFCLFANAAMVAKRTAEGIAALYALKQVGVNSVAILDWDVHHGNGTQEIVEQYQQMAYCSLHQSPGYPGTGDASERGKYNNVLNVPLPFDSTIVQYQEAFEKKVIPFLANFQPDFLIVSAGYDACTADSLGEMALQPQDYSVFIQYCLELTPRIVFRLEGGYDLQSLGQSVVATLGSCIKSGIVNKPFSNS